MQIPNFENKEKIFRLKKELLVFSGLLILTAMFLIQKENTTSDSTNATKKENLIKPLPTKELANKSQPTKPFNFINHSLKSLTKDTDPSSVEKYQKLFDSKNLEQIDKIHFGTNYMQEKEKYIVALVNSESNLKEAASILSDENLFKEIFKENQARAKILIIDSLIFAARNNQNPSPLNEATKNLLKHIRERNYNVSDTTWMDFEELLAVYLSFAISSSDLQSIQTSLQNLELEITEQELANHPSFRDVFITALYSSLKKRVPKKNLDLFIESFDQNLSNNSQHSQSINAQKEGSSYEG